MPQSMARTESTDSREGVTLNGWLTTNPDADLAVTTQLGKAALPRQPSCPIVAVAAMETVHCAPPQLVPFT